MRINREDDSDVGTESIAEFRCLEGQTRSTVAIHHVGEALPVMG